MKEPGYNADDEFEPFMPGNNCRLWDSLETIPKNHQKLTSRFIVTLPKGQKKNKGGQPFLSIGRKRKREREPSDDSDSSDSEKEENDRHRGGGAGDGQMGDENDGSEEKKEESKEEEKKEEESDDNPSDVDYDDFKDINNLNGDFLFF